MSDWVLSVPFLCLLTLMGTAGLVAALLERREWRKRNPGRKL